MTGLVTQGLAAEIPQSRDYVRYTFLNATTRAALTGVSATGDDAFSNKGPEYQHSLAYDTYSNTFTKSGYDNKALTFTTSATNEIIEVFIHPTSTQYDEELIIYDILNNNWNAGNIVKPTLLYKGDVGRHDTRNPVIKIYLVSAPSKPRSIGYTSRKDISHVTVDIRAAQRDTVLKICDEVIRVLEVKGKNPGSGYYLLTHTGKRKVASYSNFHHYVVETRLSAFTAVTTEV